MYSRWWDLKRCRAVVAALGEPEPHAPADDLKTAEPIPHEAAVRELIAKLKRDKMIGCRFSAKDAAH